MNNNQEKIQIPDEALKLLPWYAIGWLSPQERAYMQKIMAKNPELQRMLDAERETISRVKEDKGILDQSCLESTEARLAKVLSNLPANQKSSKEFLCEKNIPPLADSFNKEKPFSGEWFAKKLSPLLSSVPKIQYAAFAALTAFTIALIFAFVSPLIDDSNTFYPATATSIKISDNGATTLLIGLNTAVDDPRILSILKENNAKIYAIPGKKGMFHLSLSDKLDAKQTRMLVNKLTKNKALFWFAGEEF